MSNLNQGGPPVLPLQRARAGIVVGNEFMQFRLPGTRTSVCATGVPAVWVSYGDALRVEAGSWSVTAQAVYVAPHWPHVVDGRGQLIQGLSLRGYRWPAQVEPRPVMALSSRSLHLLVDCFDRDDPTMARELAGTLGFTPLRFSSIFDVLVQRMHADPMQRLSQSAASALTGMERSTLLKRFRAESGMTFRSYKTSMGVQTALQMLGAGHSATAAAMAGGFADLAHFSRQCRATTGYSPRQGLQYLARATAMVQAGQTRVDVHALA